MELEQKPNFFLHYFLLYLGLAWFPLIYFPKGDIELWVNQHHTAFWDIFFKYTTYIGDGTGYAILFLIFLLLRYRWTVFLALVVVIQTAFVHIFKQWLAHGTPRPKAFFHNDSILHFVQGVSVHSYDSFPSGHTATAFSIMAMIALLSANRRWVGFMLAIVAILTGFSRVYLLQHFMIDTYFGALFGVMAVLISYWIVARWEKKSPADSKWNGNLLKKDWDLPPFSLGYLFP